MYIYKTLNTLNGHFYIGKSTGSVSSRYLGSGKRLKQAITKYGKSNFKKEILQECTSEEELNRAERYWIRQFKDHEGCYNIAEGGEGGWDFLTPEIISRRVDSIYGTKLIPPPNACFKSKRKAQRYILLNSGVYESGPYNSVTELFEKTNLSYDKINYSTRAHLEVDTMYNFYYLIDGVKYYKWKELRELGLQAILHNLRNMRKDWWLIRELKDRYKDLEKII